MDKFNQTNFKNFLELCRQMREQQRAYFKGDKTAIGTAKKLEAQVDNFIQKLLEDQNTIQ